jgi:hypothetical protein
MIRTLAVTVVAEDRGLLTTEELYAAAGVAPDSPPDDEVETSLEQLGESIAEDIMTECNIAAGESADSPPLPAVPTLLRETLTESFYEWPARRSLNLSRRHGVSITSVEEDGSAVSASDYTVNGEAGILRRLNGCWSGQVIVVVYAAGFASDRIPSDLKQFARELVASRYAAQQRDQFVKGETIEVVGVETRRLDYWVGDIPGGKSSGPIPASMAGRLKRYRNTEVAIG